MVKRLILSCVVAVFTVVGIYAQTLPSVNNAERLSGVLPAVISASTYLVTGDIFVSPGSNVTLEAGTVLLFDGFVGLHVQGTLYVKGEKSKPVVLTSINDSLYSNSTLMPPAPFDWNGVDIYENALGTTINFCQISYSVYGVRSQTEYVRMDNVTFVNNGKADFTIKDARKEIVDQPYSYIHESVPISSALNHFDISSKISDAAEGEKEPSKPSIGEEPSVMKQREGVKFFRYTGLFLFLGGGATGAVFGDQYFAAQKKFEDLSDLDAVEKYTYTSNDWQEARSVRNDKAIKTSVAGVIGCLGLTTFLVTFAF